MHRASKGMAWGALFKTGCISPVLGKLRAEASGNSHPCRMGWRAAMTVNSRLPGSRESRLKEKPTGANFSVPLLPATGESGRKREQESQQLERQTPGNTQVWPLAFRSRVNKCKIHQTTYFGSSGENARPRTPVIERSH